MSNTIPVVPFHPVLPPAAAGPIYFSVHLYQEQPGKQPTKLVLLPAADLDRPVPKELIELQSAIESLGRDLVRIFNRKGRNEGTKPLADFLAELKLVAEVGLARSYPQVDVAYAMIEDLKLDVLAREIGPHRLHTTRRLAWLSFGLGGTGAVMAAVLSLFPPPVLDPKIWLVVRCLGVLLAGCAAGFWLASILRKPATSFTELTSPEREIWGPTTKFAFAVILTLVLALMFQLRVITVNLGTVQTSQVFASWSTALLLGILCGMGEQALSERITPFAAKVVGRK